MLRDAGGMGERREKNERRRAQKREERKRRERGKERGKGEEINIVYFCRGIRRTSEEAIYAWYIEMCSMLGKVVVIIENLFNFCIDFFEISVIITAYSGKE